MSGIDLSAYFARIGYRGAGAPSLAVLRELHALHPDAIVFENLDVLAGQPIRLDLPALTNKLIARRRGGYCFEQNTLFLAALGALGYRARAVAARVQWGAGNMPRARNHMLLVVTLPEGPYLADVGFGGLTLTAPLRLVTGLEQQTPHGRYRLMPAGDEFQLQARIGADWQPVYQLSLAEQTAADWELVNWFTSHSPASIFTSTLMAARPAKDRRYALRNNRLRVHYADGRHEEKTIATPGEMRAVLRRDFGLNLSAADETAIGRILPPATSP